MTTWILMYFLIGSLHSGNAFHVPYQTQEACEKAMEVLREDDHVAYAVCYEETK